MKSILKNSKVQAVLLILAIIVGIGVILHFFPNLSESFSRRGLRQLRIYILSFGIFSPLTVFFLIMLSTAIPPLPLPVPLIELATGVSFGFIGGAFIIWISQIASSVFAFYLAKLFRKTPFIANSMKTSKWDVYRSYLDKKGAIAIFLIRFVMAAPINSISYLAGLTSMSILSFSIATTLGTIPESLLYSFLGSQLQTLHIKFLYLFMIVILVGSLGFMFTLILMFLLRPQKTKKKAK